MAKPLTSESPFILRFKGWVDERFPLPGALLFVVLYGSGLLLGQLIAGDKPLHIGGWEIAGFAAVWCYFLMLRVFDEHKDYESDCTYYPERVLQRGLITLGHLKLVGVITIAVQLGLALALDRGFGSVSIWWFVVMGYSLLMAKEFFIGAWLEKRIVLYGVSHMAVMPLVMIWIVQVGLRGAPLSFDVGLLAALCFFSGAIFELARKTRGPEEERDGVDSYTKSLGLRGSPLTVIAFVAVAAVLETLLVQRVLEAPGLGWFIAIGLGALVSFASLALFLLKPSKKRRKLNEGMTAATILTGYVVVLSALISANGLAWG